MRESRETQEHAIELSEPPELVAAALARAADAWGAELEQDEDRDTAGTLHLPFVAGLRRGLLSGPVTVEPIAEGSRVVFREERSIRHVHTPSVFVLLIAGVGALLTVLWPFFPRLLPISSLGAVLALGGWFLVISRLQTSGPDEFLASLAAEVGGAPPPRSPSQPVSR
jgi:hypothetical protein